MANKHLSTRKRLVANLKRGIKTKQKLERQIERKCNSLGLVNKMLRLAKDDLIKATKGDANG